jgi:hypothetical protein
MQLQKAVDKVGNSAAAVRTEPGVMGDFHGTLSARFVSVPAGCVKTIQTVPGHRNGAVGMLCSCQKVPDVGNGIDSIAALLAPGLVRDALLQKGKAYEAEIPEDGTYE